MGKIFLLPFFKSGSEIFAKHNFIRMHIELNTLFVKVAKELAQNPWANSQTGRQNFDYKSQVRIRKKKFILKILAYY